MKAYCPTCRAAVETAAADRIPLGAAVRCPRCGSRLETWRGQVETGSGNPDPAPDPGPSEAERRLPPGCRPLPDGGVPVSTRGRALRRVMASTRHGRLAIELLRLAVWVGLLVLLPAVGMGLGWLLGDGRLAGALGLAAIVLLMIVACLRYRRPDLRRRWRGALVFGSLAGVGAYLALVRTEPAFALEGAAIIGVLVFVGLCFDWPEAD